MDAEDLRVRMKTHTAEFGLSKKLNTCGFEEQRIPKKERTNVIHLRSGTVMTVEDVGKVFVVAVESFVGARSSRYSRS